MKSDTQRKTGARPQATIQTIDRTSYEPAYVQLVNTCGCRETRKRGLVGPRRNPSSRSWLESRFLCKCTTALVMSSETAADFARSAGFLETELVTSSQLALATRSPRRKPRTHMSLTPPSRPPRRACTTVSSIGAVRPHDSHGLAAEAVGCRPCAGSVGRFRVHGSSAVLPSVTHNCYSREKCRELEPAGTESGPARWSDGLNGGASAECHALKT